LRARWNTKWLCRYDDFIHGWLVVLDAAAVLLPLMIMMMIMIMMLM